jgi:alpha-amylase
MTANFLNAIGVGGTTADTSSKQYPGVPYGPGDFNPTCPIIDWNDPKQVSNCDI